ncbi:MAG: response regulator transcription factor [Oleiphilus sp.]
MAKILLVDDDQMISKMMKLRLNIRKHEVDCAFDGQEAYDLAIHRYYDIILLDMHMPKMGGCETAAKLRKNHYKGLIIAVTASVLEQDTQAAIDAGCDGFIAKPLNQDFEEQVESMISMKPIREQDNG